jgi:drug/metabolite transporter (DMT)-like permease
MVFVVLVWGANFSFIKWALSEIPPLAFGAIRFTVATLLLVGWLRWREGPLRWPRSSARSLLWLGLIGNTAYQTLFILGVNRTTAANAALMVAATPVIVAILVAITGVERLTGRVVLGVVLATGGVGLVLRDAGLELSSRTLAGDLLVLAAACCWAVYTVGVRAVREPMSSLRVTALTMVTGTPLLVLIGLPELRGLEWRTIGLAGWGGTAYATVLALVVAYVMWARAVQIIGSARTALFGAGIPVVAMLVGWPLLGERPGPAQALGAVLIVGGVLVARGGASGGLRTED